LIISEERKKRIIDLYYNQGKTTREIAKIERMSIRDIHAIITEEEARRQKHKQQEISITLIEIRYVDQTESIIITNVEKLALHIK
jgi:hypothetical protein